MTVSIDSGEILLEIEESVQVLPNPCRLLQPNTWFRQSGRRGKPDHLSGRDLGTGRRERMWENDPRQVDYSGNPPDEWRGAIQRRGEVGRSRSGELDAN